MTFSEHFGRDHSETPVSPEDQEAFVDGVEFSTKFDLYEAEKSEMERVSFEVRIAILTGDLTYEEILSHGFLEGLHQNMYKSIYTWAGAIRTRPPGFTGSEAHNIRDEIAETLELAKFLIENVESMSAEEICMQVHHRLVLTHPFIDGNGRITRLYADLLLLSLTDDNRVFSWIKSPEYFAALGEADRDPLHRVDSLLSLIKTQSIMDPDDE